MTNIMTNFYLKGLTVIEEKQKALEAMKKVGELADQAVTEADKAAAWNQKRSELASALKKDDPSAYRAALALDDKGLIEKGMSPRRKGK